MSMVNLKINDKPVQAPAGSTILEASRLIGVDIPVLCHHPKLQNLGSCRICLVEIAKQPNLHPACTYPVFEGMEVQTESERVVEMRKFVLDMLFSERNHHCMYCEMSGDCELQNLAYRYKMDRWSFPSPHPHLPLDATRKYFLLDHNRCVLCRRCIRACSDLAANQTLGVKNRGSETMISADMDLPFNESSCTSCGTCLEVCPTGALVDRKSAYMGRNAEVDRVAGTCAICAVGCGIKVVSRGGQLLRVESDWDQPNGGVLCVAGRFEPLYDARPKITVPKVRRDGKLEDATWDEALDAISSAMKKTSGGDTLAVTTGQVLNETMNQFVTLFKSGIGAQTQVLESALNHLDLPADGSLSDVDTADCILMVGGDPLNVHRVLGYRIKRAIHRGCEVHLVSSDESPMSELAVTHGMGELEAVVARCAAAQSPLVIYGGDLKTKEANLLAALRGKAKFIPLFPAANGYRAKVLDLSPVGRVKKIKAMYVLLQDVVPEEAWVEEFRRPAFLAVHASRESALTEKADVVLPSPQWYQREGSFINMEGRNVAVHAAFKTPDGFLSETECFDRLSEKMGK